MNKVGEPNDRRQGDLGISDLSIFVVRCIRLNRGREPRRDDGAFSHRNVARLSAGAARGGLVHADLNSDGGAVSGSGASGRVRSYSPGEAFRFRVPPQALTHLSFSPAGSFASALLRVNPPGDASGGPPPPSRRLRENPHQSERPARSRFFWARRRSAGLRGGLQPGNFTESIFSQESSNALVTSCTPRLSLRGSCARSEI